MSDSWEQAGRARRAYADMVEGLSDEQLDHATLCDAWNVRQVTGHLASFVEVGLPSFFANMAKHRFDYDRAAHTLASKHGERPIADLVAALRARAEKKSTVPMFPGEMTTTDVVVHTQDVRRALGLDGSPDADFVEAALEFLATHKLASAIVGKGVYDGLSFEATDLGWSHGDGAAVTGPGEAVMMAMAGRPVWDELSGDGVATLRDRFKSR